MTTTMMMSGKEGRNRPSMFREEQTDLLNVFQHHQFDLLEGNPPPQNPDYVASMAQSNPPQNPEFVPSLNSPFPDLPTTTTNSERSIFPDLVPPAGSIFPDLLSPLSNHRRQSSNPFEEDNVTPNSGTTRAFEGSLFGIGRHEHGSAAWNRSGAFSSNSSAVPVASVVAISDEEEDVSIPFVSAMPIDEHETNAFEREWSNRTSLPQHASSPGPAIRVAGPQPPMPRAVSQGTDHRVNEAPEWLGQSSNPPRRRADSTHRALARHKTNWSRISIQARATMKDAKRNLKRTLSREAKKLKTTIRRETKQLSRSMHSFRV